MAQSLINDNYLYYSKEGKWPYDEFKIKQLQRGEVITLTQTKSIKDIYLYYANIIDYFRILLSLIAIILQVLYKNQTNFHMDYLIATLIMGNVLLDWVDGPVARAYNQSSVYGSGMDWLADILAQQNIAMWAIMRSDDTFFVSFTTLFSIVEFGTCIFDFAQGCKGIYPQKVYTENLPWYFKVEHWLIPGNDYNYIGTLGWLCNTILPLAVCLRLHYCIIVPTIPFAFLYAWHELTQFMFIISNWQEFDTQMHQQGIQYIRDCKPDEIELIQNVFNLSKPHIVTKEQTEIYWQNLFVNDEYRECIQNSPYKTQISEFVTKMMAENYSEPRRIASYGFIISPPNGLKSQKWHYDYEYTFSNIFIPLTQVSVNNATNFTEGVIQDNLEEFENDLAPADFLGRDQNIKNQKTSQIIVKPFSITKLHQKVVHRGIANSENTPRIVFFIGSISKSSAYQYIPEDLKEQYDSDKEEDHLSDLK